MSVPTIFLINNDQIVEMSDQPYDSEKRLQELLAKFPSVLAGDQMSGTAPVKWLLVEQEAGIPCEAGGGGRWSLDHLFVDQDGVPTLVEVKRKSDTRLRREVVGQMLDYAANAVLHWPNGNIRQRFEKMSLNSDAKVSEFIGCTGAADAEAMISSFWDKVETNLRAGKIRIVFVADEIPTELKRIVEFLNQQMNPAEVLAIEVRQYVGPGVRTLVPTVIRSSKFTPKDDGRQTAETWDRESLTKALLERKGLESVSIANAILDWASTHDLVTSWGKGFQDGSCYVGMSHAGVKYVLFAIWTYGRISPQFGTLQHLVPAKAIEGLASAMNEIPGIHMTQDVLNKYPAFDIPLLKEPEMRSKFFQAIEKFAENIKATSNSTAASLS